MGSIKFALIPPLLHLEYFHVISIGAEFGSGSKVVGLPTDGTEFVFPVEGLLDSGGV